MALPSCARAGSGEEGSYQRGTDSQEQHHPCKPLPRVPSTQPLGAHLHHGSPAGSTGLYWAHVGPSPAQGCWWELWVLQALDMVRSGGAGQLRGSFYCLQ